MSIPRWFLAIFSLSFLSFLFFFLPGAGAATRVSGDVFGTWSDDVWVDGDLRVPYRKTLTVEPGVHVLFEGPFKLLVEGRLDAIGTPEEEIVLTRAYPTEDSKWRGIRFDYADDASLLEYCRIEYVKSADAYPEVRGGGVWINYCSPTVRHCTMTLNSSHNGNSNGAGGGVCLNEASQSVIEYNHIVNNQADSGAGILVGWESDAVIRYNVIEGNQAFYAGGGIYVSANSEAAIYGNVIQQNTAAGWGGGGINLWSGTVFYGTYSYVYDNMILNNTSTSGSDACGGGGIYSRYDTSVLCNNTIAGNQAVKGGGLYVLTYSYLPPQVYNTIVWNNTAPTGPSIFLYADTGSAAEVAYCDVEGGWSGTGNLDEDPLFANAAEGDCHLRFDSPCLDRGTLTAPYLPDKDFEGDPRLAYELIDMGADEFYTHLYWTGEASPGGDVTVKMTSPPGTTPAGLFLGVGFLEEPLNTKWGAWYLAYPWVGPFLFPPFPSQGMIELPATLPLDPPGPYTVPMQALLGQVLTNLSLLEVE